jgi:hypothetical protein
MKKRSLQAISDTIQSTPSTSVCPLSASESARARERPRTSEQERERESARFGGRGGGCELEDEECAEDGECAGSGVVIASVAEGSVNPSTVSASN